MKYIVAAFIGMLALHSFSYTDSQLNGIHQLEWKNRILIVWSDNPEEDYSRIYHSNRTEIDDRDMVIFVLSQSTLMTNYQESVSVDFFADVKRRFPIKQANYFLVGKDGGIKSRGKYLDLQQIFGEIDLMPMRQQEMKNHK